MFVRGHPDIVFSEVADVIDIAKGAQVEKIGLMTENLDEPMQ
jgi:biopolymer transport protein ExbD